MPLEIDGIPPYIVNFINVYDIGAVYFQEGLAVQLLFHMLEGAIGDIALTGSDEFYIVTHAFYE